jgi:uncharacterized membrane protein YfcA
MNPIPALSLFTASVFLLAGGVKGVVGLGLPTVAMALLALRMAPAQAAALLIMPSLITNLWQIRPWNTLGPMLRRLAPMQMGVAFGTLAGAWVLGAPSGAWARVSLGVALIVYAGWGLAGLQQHVRVAHEAWLGPIVGAATGLVTAATGVFVIPAVPYLQALGFKRDELIQAMGISFTVSTLSLAAGLMANVSASAADLGVSMLMLLPALLGMAVGQHLRQRLSPLLFRRCFLLSLTLLGTHMIGRELWMA